MAPVSASSDHRASWVYHTGGAAMWGWMVPYAILKGRNTLERSGRTDLMPRLDAYGEPGTNFGQPLTDAEYRHLPIQDWGERLQETAPYFAEHVRQADDGAYWDRSNLNRHAASVNVPILHISSWYDIFAEGAAPHHGAMGALVSLRGTELPRDRRYRLWSGRTDRASYGAFALVRLLAQGHRYGHHGRAASHYLHAG
jgi:predicted acyl esterase